MDWTKEDVKAYMEKHNCSENDAYKELGMNEDDIERYLTNRLTEYLEDLLKMVFIGEFNATHDKFSKMLKNDNGKDLLDKIAICAALNKLKGSIEMTSFDICYILDRINTDEAMYVKECLLKYGEYWVSSTRKYLSRFLEERSQ